MLMSLTIGMRKLYVFKTQMTRKCFTEQRVPILQLLYRQKNAGPVYLILRKWGLQLLSHDSI